MSSGNTGPLELDNWTKTNYGMLYRDLLNWTKHWHKLGLIWSVQIHVIKSFIFPKYLDYSKHFTENMVSDEWFLWFY